MPDVTTDSPEVKAFLEKKQAENLAFAESWYAGLILGVPVVQAMSYFLIQALNHVTLEEMLKGGTGDS